MLSGISRRLRLAIVAIVLLSAVSFVGAGTKSEGSDRDLPGPFRIDAAAVTPDELTLDSACVREGAAIVVSGTCEVRLPSQLLPHELRIRVVLGTPRVIVRQKVRGEVPAPLPSPTFGPAQTFTVSAAGDGDTQITITCLTPTTGCRLEVLG